MAHIYQSIMTNSNSKFAGFDDDNTIFQNSDLKNTIKKLYSIIRFKL